MDSITKILIESIPDINQKDTAGRTMLHRAVLCEMSIDHIKFLISKGADINVKDSEGMTPLHLCVKNSNKQIIILLLEQGADCSDILGNKTINTYNCRNDSICGKMRYCFS